jgi:hypothetical protein
MLNESMEKLVVVKSSTDEEENGLMGCAYSQEYENATVETNSNAAKANAISLDV